MRMLQLWNQVQQMRVNELSMCECSLLIGTACHAPNVLPLLP
jgi:hypothetical protein